MKVKGAIHVAEMDESPRAIYSWYYYFGITTKVQPKPYRKMKVIKVCGVKLMGLLSSRRVQEGGRIMKLAKRNDEDIKIKLILASDSKFFIGGIRKILESAGDIQVLAEASECREIEKCLCETKPGFLFLDNRRLKLDIIKLLCLIDEKSLSSKVILLDDHEYRVHTPLNLIHITKGINSSKLIEIIRGKTTNKKAPTKKSNSKKTTSKLTKKQLTVIEFIASGFTNKEIANEFSISEKTVKAHLTNIFSKLGVQNRYQLQLMAYTKQFSLKTG